MLSSYFDFSRMQLVAFDKNVQAIAYSYNKRSCTFVGVINNRSRHSSSDLVFLKKYVAYDGAATIFHLGQLIGSLNKVGSAM
jgi:hypothetical protein